MSDIDSESNTGIIYDDLSDTDLDTDFDTNSDTESESESESDVDYEEDEKIRMKILKNKRYRMVEKLKKIPRRHNLMTIRYTSETHAEMLAYCKNTTAIKCIYSTPKEVSDCVVRDAILFVLEMNNDKKENRIMGIGMLKNTPYPNRYGVHADGNLNRFNYLGKMRIDRNDMTKEEEEIMRAFDAICFKGPNHQKRCHGITIFPLDVLEKCKSCLNLTEFVVNMFKTRFPK